MIAREITRKFECRLATEPGQWAIVDAKSAADAAEMFAFNHDHKHGWHCAQGNATIIVVVRSMEATEVSASYRVTGRVVPAYKATMLVPGEEAVA